MRKLIFTLILLMPFFINAQQNSSSIKLGYFSPQVTDGGFIIGYQGGNYIDERFEYGFSIDWFNKEYVDQSLVSALSNDFGIGQDYELIAKTNLHSFPLMMNLQAKFPINRMAKFYINGGIGLDLILVYYRSYENPDDDNIKGAADFNYRIGFGASYQLGSRSEAIAEIAYHSSEPSWEYEVEGKVFERVYDMSGVMARIGVRFFY